MKMTVKVGVLLVFLAVGTPVKSDIMDSFLSIVGTTADSLLTLDTPMPIEEDVTFWCWNNNIQTIQKTGIDDPQLQSTLNLTLPVTFLVHGFLENVETIWIRNTLRDLCLYRLTNACGVDWRRLASFIYSMSAKHTLKVGQYVASFIEFLLTKGIPMDNIILVGFSLGAHIAGIAGSTLGGRVPLIIALDPAGPLKTYPQLQPIEERLDPTDALSVQAIYTCIFFLGSVIPVGTQNFYPAGGFAPQPWCATNFLRIPTPKSIACSHLVAAEIFQRSINSLNVIEGTMCVGDEEFNSGKCADGQRDRLGLDSNRFPGKFYLNFDTPALSVSDFVFPSRR